MIQTALAIALVLYVAIAGVLLRECAFLMPFRVIIWEQCGEILLWFSLALVLNLFAGIYAVLRKLALKDTGDKLSHLEKQLRGRTSISDELTERILQRK